MPAFAGLIRGSRPPIAYSRSRALPYLADAATPAGFNRGGRKPPQQIPLQQLGEGFELGTSLLVGLG